jgi:hypothetical protein
VLGQQLEALDDWGQGDAPLCEDLLELESTGLTG